MRKPLCIWGSAAFIAMLAAHAVAGSPAAPTRQDRNVVIISAQVGADCATLVNDEINKWTVINASVLKGFEGAYVTVKGRVDADLHTIHVLSVKRQRLARANPGDSAFRR